MNEPFVGQIQLFPYLFAPRYWLHCDGQLLAIVQYQELYSLLGNQFGGDGMQTFALPKLTGPAPNVQYFIATAGIYPQRP
jgi:microcystin-dependent protein